MAKMGRQGYKETRGSGGVAGETPRRRGDGERRPAEEVKGVDGA